MATFGSLFAGIGAGRLPCSYLTMCDQREGYLRGKGGPDRFQYDCHLCPILKTCSDDAGRKRSVPPLADYRLTAEQECRYE